ncbi:MAG: AbrB/MazE/SpoVT family DNA-binding domain-containing protein [Candidatus Woesearchaeota archaeon]|nr:AbrB/MazE/SpoVT family DNA-binding domain-containing protein [Candidatus Woesearchaeota archaeon]
MKRKIIQLAGKTLVVSIPSALAKKYGLLKGQEIEVEEQGSKIVINLGNSTSIEKKSIKISGMSEMLGRVVGALYKAGYDEIEIEFSSSDELKEIQRTLNRTCIGFEIVRQGDTTLTTREISKLEPEQFEAVLRRLFLFLLTSADDSLKSASPLNIDGLKNIKLRDDNLNRFADFCRRVINKNGCPGFKRTAPIYFITEELEKIGDSYKDLAEHLAENKTSLSKKTLNLYGEINSFLRDFYELFYSFNLVKYEEFGKKKNKILLELENQMKIAKKDEVIVLSFLNNLLNQIFDMNGSLITSFI